MPRNTAIVYDISKSNFSVDVGKATFYLSSPLYKEKFEARVKEFIDTNKTKLRILYGIDNISDEYLASLLYLKIEKRGYRVKVGEDTAWQPSQVKLNGEIVITRQ